MIGSKLGPYTLIAELGSGGMGTVYRAQGPQGVVALKTVHAHLVSSPGYYQRFLREAAIGRKVDHRNVVRTLDAGACDAGGRQVDYLVMEFVEGQTLRGLLTELTKVPEQLCRHLGREAAHGVSAIHAAGAVHRDLKPENVLVTPEHVVKVMDLGVARIVDTSMRLSDSGSFVGSVHYAAPEQFQDPDGIDARVDLWAIGVMLYELSTGVHPFAASDVRAALRRILDEQPRPASELNPQLSPFFEELLAQLLRKDRDARFGPAESLAYVLECGEESDWWRERASVLRRKTRRPLRRIRIQRETALYGRDAEIALLRARFERAAAGDGQVVLVEGEAGIGKSRLVDEFVGVLEREGEEVNFLFGSYPPGGAATATGAFVAAYRDQFGAEDLEQGLRGMLPQTPLLVPAFAALLRGDVVPPGAEPLTKDSLQTVFVHSTRSLGAQRTTIVCIDDLHFAPPEGLALFAALAMAVPGHRVMLVGTMRPGVDETWLSSIERLGRTTRIPLARLGPKDLARLLVEAFRSERLAEALAFRIATKSDGNPYFVFEILRSLREGGALARAADGSWASVREVVDIEIPSSVRELVSARLADLDAEDRELLQAAACQGFEFDPSLVAEALGLPAFPALKRFARIETQHRLIRAAGRHYVFDHHQVQETLYAGLFEQLREQYHAALANALEARTGASAKDPGSVDGPTCLDLADQFLLGGQGARALRYLDGALSHLEGVWQHDAVLRLSRRALASPGLLAGPERARLLLRMARTLAIVGRNEDERAVVEEALALADHTGDAGLRATARCQRGTLDVREGRMAEAERVLSDALVIACGSGLREIEGTIRLRLLNVAFHAARFDDVQMGSDAVVAIAREIGAPSLEQAALARRAHVYASTGRDAEAHAIFQQQVELARRDGDLAAELTATANLATVSIDRGHLASACAWFDRHFELAQRMGNRVVEASARANSAILRAVLGDVERARRDGALGLDLAREVGAAFAESQALVGLAVAASLRGDDAEAVRLLEEAAELRRRGGFRAQLAICNMMLARIHTDAGRVEDARRRLDEGSAVVDAIGGAQGRAHIAVHRARLGDGDAAAAAALLDEQRDALDVWDAMQLRWYLWQATGDRAQLAEARRILAFLVEHAPPECRESMIANVRPHGQIVEGAAQPPRSG